jgi:hypothetical protein
VAVTVKGVVAEIAQVPVPEQPSPTQPVNT